MKVELTVSTLADARATRAPESSDKDGDFRRTLDGAREERDPSIDRQGEPVRRDRQEDVEENSQGSTDSTETESNELEAVVAEVTDAFIEAAVLTESGSPTGAIAEAAIAGSETLAPVGTGPVTGVEVDAVVDAPETVDGSVAKPTTTGTVPGNAAITEDAEATAQGPLSAPEGEAADEAEIVAKRDPRQAVKTEEAAKQEVETRTVLDANGKVRVSDAARSLEASEEGTTGLPLPPRSATAKSATADVGNRFDFHLAGKGNEGSENAVGARATDTPEVAKTQGPQRAAEVLQSARSATSTEATVDRVASESRSESGRPVTELGQVDRSQPRSTPESRAINGAASAADASVKDDPLDEAQLAKRIHRLVRRSIASGRGILRVQIDPPNLGRVQVRFDVREEGIGVRFEVENKEVRQVLDRHVEELRETLAGFGRADAEVSVDVRDGSSDTFDKPGRPSRGGFASGDGVESEEVEVVTLTLDGAHIGRNVDVSL